MKKTIKTAICAAAFLFGAESPGQIIDLSTGIDNNTGLMQPFTQPSLPVFDDTWMVLIPGGSGYQQVPVGDGYMDPLNNTYAGRDLTVRWISPVVNQWGKHLDNQPVGYYYYRMQFRLTGCEFEACQNGAVPAVINFKHIGGDNVIDQVQVNNATYNVNYPYNSFVNNTSIVLGNNDLQPGWNTVTLRLDNYHHWTGMEINGSLVISGGMAFNLKDQLGNVGNTFCLLQDVFLDPGAMKMNGYNIDILQGGNTVASYQGSGQMANFNLSKLLKSQNVNVQPNTLYKVRYSINTSCGWLTHIVDLQFECCESSLDASFKAMVSPNGEVTAEASGSGSHTWSIYTTPQAHTGPYTLVKTETKAAFTYNAGYGCYFIKHEVSNGCGDACDAQTVCHSSCDNTECILSAPNATYDPQTNMITWLPVPGAAYYKVVITYNDPACCGSGDVMQAPTVHEVVVYGTSHPATLPPLEGGPPLRCYSFKVYAFCPDGTPSPNSRTICFGGGIVEGRSVATGIEALQVSLNEFSLYPNPASGSFFISLNGMIERNVDIRITNTVGLEVFLLKDQQVKGGQTINVNTVDLPKGIYLVTVASSGEKQVQKKLIIE